MIFMHIHKSQTLNRSATEQGPRTGRGRDGAPVVARGANKRFFSPLNPPPTHVFFFRLEPLSERSSKLGHGILEEGEEGAVVTRPIKVFEIHAQLCCLSASGTLLINLVRAVYVYGFDGRCSRAHCTGVPSRRVLFWGRVTRNKVFGLWAAAQLFPGVENEQAADYLGSISRTQCWACTHMYSFSRGAH